MIGRLGVGSVWAAAHHPDLALSSAERIAPGVHGSGGDARELLPVGHLPVDTRVVSSDLLDLRLPFAAAGLWRLATRSHQLHLAAHGHESVVVERAETGEGHRLSLGVEEADDVPGQPEGNSQRQRGEDECGRDQAATDESRAVSSGSCDHVGPVAGVVVERLDERIEEVLHRATSSSSSPSFVCALLDIRTAGPDRDPERLGDRPVVEVGVVAQEEREALPLGEQRERRSHAGVRLVRQRAVPARSPDRVPIEYIRAAPCMLVGGVDDDAPQPALSWPSPRKLRRFRTAMAKPS